MFEVDPTLPAFGRHSLNLEPWPREYMKLIANLYLTSSLGPSFWGPSSPTHFWIKYQLKFCPQKICRTTNRQYRSMCPEKSSIFCSLWEEEKIAVF